MADVSNNNAEMEKFLSDLNAVDFDDLGDGFQAVTVNAGQWERYQQIVRALTAARGKGRGIVKINYLEKPDPAMEYASAMIVLDKVVSFDGDAKAALIVAATLCDRIAVTTSGNKIRASFTVNNIWQDEESAYI